MDLINAKEVCRNCIIGQSYHKEGKDDNVEQ